MAVKPKIRTITNNSVDVLNAIRNNASTNYREYVPVATKDPEQMRKIGAIIMDSPSLKNEFLSALANRIGRVIIISKTYENPWAKFKKGLLEFGETVEEIFVEIAKPFQYDPAVAENTLFKREIPDVRAAFHIMNYQKFYKSTIQNNDIRLAFLSDQGMTDLIGKIVDALYTGANYDEFLVMKYMLARHILDGLMRVQQISAVSSANMKSIVADIKGTSNDMEFMKTKYNLAGVHTHSPKDQQYLIVNSKFDATMDVEVLASAFNMSKAEFLGHRVLVDSFGDIDKARLAELFEDDPTYVEITDDELTALDAIPCVLVDENWFMIYDNFEDFTEAYNGEGLYWNYFYHTWKTFSVSPFANNTLFVAGEPSVTSVEVSPSTATASGGQNISFSAEVTTANFAPQTVDWSVNDDACSISKAGTLYIPLDVSQLSASTLTVTAKSVYDDTVYDTATVTVVS